jgi:hypothetical protein
VIEDEVLKLAGCIPDPRTCVACFFRVCQSQALTLHQMTLSDGSTPLRIMKQQQHQQQHQQQLLRQQPAIFSGSWPPCVTRIQAFFSHVEGC